MVTRQKVLIAFLLLSALSAQAANHCVRSGASGANNGTTWDDAYTALPAALTRGDTYYIADGTYGAYTYNDAASGTTLITIKKATESDHGIATGWNSTYGDGQASFTGLQWFNTAYWVFDGVNGALTETSSAYGFLFSSVQRPIEIYNTSIDISNISISHVSAIAPAADVEKFFIGTDNATKRINFVTVSRCLVNGYQNGYWATSAALLMDSWIWEYNICLNLFSSGSNHGEWINNNFGVHTNRITRFNVFKGGGNGATGVVVSNNEDTWNDQIYGNVVVDMEVSNGIFTGTSAGQMHGAVIYNNTIINTETSGGWLGGYPANGSVARNNLLFSMSAEPGATDVTRSYNAYFGCSNVPAESNRQLGVADPFANWMAGNYQLTAHTTSGVTLASPWDVDPNGVTRGVGGIWDRGAFQIAGVPTPPTAVSVVSAGRITFSGRMTIR